MASNLTNFRVNLFVEKTNRYIIITNIYFRLSPIHGVNVDLVFEMGQAGLPGIRIYYYYISNSYPSPPTRITASVKKQHAQSIMKPVGTFDTSELSKLCSASLSRAINIVRMT